MGFSDPETSGREAETIQKSAPRVKAKVLVGPKEKEAGFPSP
jgi:hypothetical protein